MTVIHQIRIGSFQLSVKVVQGCFGFALLCYVIVLGNTHYLLKLSNAKLKSITTWSLASSRPLGRLPVFKISSYWLLKVFSFHMIGLCNNFGFSFTIINKKAF